MAFQRTIPTFQRGVLGVPLLSGPDWHASDFAARLCRDHAARIFSQTPLRETQRHDRPNRQQGRRTHFIDGIAE